MSEDYVTYLPRTIELDDGSRIILTEEEVLRGVLRLYVPPSLIDKLNDHLRKKGFLMQFQAYIKARNIV